MLLILKRLKDPLYTEVMIGASGEWIKGLGLMMGTKDCHFIVLFPLFKKKSKYDKMLTSVHSG